MIKTLHRTTPQLKMTDTHEVGYKPYETGYLSSRRPNTCSLSRRRMDVLGNSNNNNKSNNIDTFKGDFMKSNSMKTKIYNNNNDNTLI